MSLCYLHPERDKPQKQCYLCLFIELEAQTRGLNGVQVQALISQNKILAEIAAKRLDTPESRRLCVVENPIQ